MGQIKNYNVVEKTFLVKLFYNEKVRNEYLGNILPQIFYNPAVRLAIYVIKTLFERKVIITMETITTFLEGTDDKLLTFKRKFNLFNVKTTDIIDILSDVELDSSGYMVDNLYEMLISSAFARFVDTATIDMIYWNGFQSKEYENRILARAKGIVTVHNILRRIGRKQRNQLQETLELVNSPEEYISTSSTVLNSYIGGFSRGYISVIIGKSSHTKSTWTDYNSVHTILTKKADRIDIITPEESAATRWRRVIAMVMKIPTTAMRQKSIKILPEHIARIDKLFRNKLVIHDDIFKYKDIIDLMESLNKTDMIILDHLQALDYPGGGSALQRMIGNIPGLINIEKRIAKHRNMVIMNLSQVNDKDIQRSDRTIKAPRYWDAYGSSVLYQASREFLSFWYPYKDFEDTPIMFTDNPPSINEIQLSIEKSSFSRIGKFMLRYNPEFATFQDYKKTLNRILNKEDYIPPVEKEFEQLDLFNESKV